MFFMLLVFYALPVLIVIGALIDILKSDFDPHQSKIIWVIVVILVPVIGSILYWVIGRKQRIERF